MVSRCTWPLTAPFNVLGRLRLVNGDLVKHLGWENTEVHGPVATTVRGFPTVDDRCSKERPQSPNGEFGCTAILLVRCRAGDRFQGITNRQCRNIAYFVRRTIHRRSVWMLRLMSIVLCTVALIPVTTTLLDLGPLTRWFWIGVFLRARLTELPGDQAQARGEYRAHLSGASARVRTSE